MELGPKTHDEMQAATLRLIGITYEAALDPARWDDFLRVYSEFYPGTSQWIWIEDRERADVRILTCEACDRSYVPSYLAHYAATNPWTEGAFSHPEGWIHIGDWNAPREVLKASEFYNDWLKPQDLDDGIGSIILKSGGQMMMYSLLHSKRVTTGERDLKLLRLLVPHMQRAARLHGHFLALQSRAGVTEDLLNRLSTGALLCDTRGRIQLMNRAAQEMVLAGDGLSLIGGRLVPVLKTEADRLDRLLAVAAAMADGSTVTTGGALSVSRPSGRRAYGLTVAPYRGEAPSSPWASLAPATCVVIFIADPELRRAPPEELLAGLYGLTGAEARLASLVAAGLPLAEIADISGITRETARSQLKSVFSKTVTHSQAQLVSLLSQALAVSGGGDLNGDWAAGAGRETKPEVVQGAGDKKGGRRIEPL